MRGSLRGDRPLIRLRFAPAPSPTMGEGRAAPATPSTRRSHLIRKLLPDFRAPASIGGARGRRQYPHPGIADQLQLLAIVSLAIEEFLPRRLAGERKELRTKCRDCVAKPGAIRRRQ